MLIFTDFRLFVQDNDCHSWSEILHSDDPATILSGVNDQSEKIARRSKNSLTAKHHLPHHETSEHEIQTHKKVTSPSPRIIAQAMFLGIAKL